VFSEKKFNDKLTSVAFSRCQLVNGKMVRLPSPPAAFLFVLSTFYVFYGMSAHASGHRQTVRVSVGQPLQLSTTTGDDHHNHQQHPSSPLLFVDEAMLPEWCAFNASARLIYGLPQLDDLGAHVVVIKGVWCYLF
jgi:hypothetical protein